MLLHNLSGVIGTIWALGGTLASAAITVESTVLVIARNDADAQQVTLGLDGYGIPYEKLLVPQGGVALPTLNTSLTQGRYGGIITVSDVSYENNGTWGSAITAQQLAQIHAYQATFKVRMVRINEFPGPDFGKHLHTLRHIGLSSYQLPFKVSPLRLPVPAAVTLV